MKNLIVFLAAVTMFCGCKRNKPKDTFIPNHAYMDSARFDFAKGRLKYYFHSISLPNPKFMKMMQEQFHIRIAGIDRPSPEEISYNLITDSIILAKTGKSIQYWISKTNK